MSRYEDNSNKYDEAEANLKPIVDRLEAEWTTRHETWVANGCAYADVTWIELARLSQAIQSITGRFHTRALGSARIAEPDHIHERGTRDKNRCRECGAFMRDGA